MVWLQGLWCGDRLHVAGLRDAGFIGGEELRRVVGDAWDTLLASAGDASSLTLRWPNEGTLDQAHEEPKRDRIAPPTRGGATLEFVRAGSSTTVLETAPHQVTPQQAAPHQATSHPASPLEGRGVIEPRMVERVIPTLAFGASEAMDLLTAPVAGGDASPGDSLRYWSKAARMGLELLAKQRFVPDLHAAGGERYRGFWRALIDDSVSARVHALADAMPPVCHSMIEDDGQEPAAILESFLWQTVDAFVRRCLDGDELAHALHEQTLDDAPPQVRWLRSLVEADATLGGAASQNAALYQTVRGWLSRLDPPPKQREFRTCLRLESPEDLEADGGRTGWRLSLQVQLLGDDKMLVDAAELSGGPRAHPRILPRPFDDALTQVRADAAEAAVHVPALAACAAADGPLECPLSLMEAYTFLRDATPVLRLEGFGVFTPSWWEESRFRPRMRLHVRPKSDEAGVSFGAMRLDA